MGRGTIMHRPKTAVQKIERDGRLAEDVTDIGDVNMRT